MKLRILGTALASIAVILWIAALSVFDITDIFYDWLGGLLVLFGLGAWVNGFLLNHQNLPGDFESGFYGSMMLAFGLCVLPVGPWWSLLAVVIFSILASVTTAGEGKISGSGVWSGALSLALPMSGMALYQYLLSTQRSCVDAIVLVGFGTVVALWLCPKAPTMARAPEPMRIRGISA